MMKLRTSVFSQCKQLVLERWKLLPAKREQLEINKIVSLFKQEVNLNGYPLPDPKSEKLRVALARKIKVLSEEKLHYYDSSRFGFIKKFFSSLRNISRLGTFTSSGQYGYDVAVKFLSQHHPHKPEGQPAKKSHHAPVNHPLASQDKTQIKKKKNKKAAAKISAETTQGSKGPKGTSHGIKADTLNSAENTQIPKGSKRISLDIQAKTEELAQIIETHLPPKDKPEQINPFSQAQLDQFLQLSDQIQQSVAHENQLKKLSKALEERVGKENADAAWKMAGLIPASVNNSQNKLTDEVIQFLAARVDNYFKNQDTIKTLKQKIKEDLGDEEYFKSAFDKIHPENYQNGSLLLTQEIQAQLCDLAKTLKAEKDFQNILATIKDLASKDLYLNDAFIESKFKIADTLKFLSAEEQVKRRQQLQLIINTAFLNHELRKKGNYVSGSKDEMNLLSCLGYDVYKQESAYGNKEEIYKTLVEIVRKQLKAEQFSDPNSLFSKALKECGLKARLKMVKITEETLVAKFQAAFKLYQDKKVEMVQKAKEVALDYPQAFPKEKLTETVNFIESNYEALKGSAIKFIMTKLFEFGETKKKFQDITLSRSDFEIFLKNRIANLENKAETELKKECHAKQKLLKNHMDFYSKWGSYIKFDFIQGNPDLNDALGTGVCYALCQRTFKEAVEQRKNHPIDEPNAANKFIKPSDRFLQAKYKISMMKDDKHAQKYQANRSNKKVYENTYKPKNLNCIFDLTEALKENLLHPDQVWMDISLQGPESGHALLMRLDKVENKIWLYDPNAGMFCFEKEGGNFEEARQKCLECFADLFALDYADEYNRFAFYALDPNIVDKTPQ